VSVCVRACVCVCVCVYLAVQSQCRLAGSVSRVQYCSHSSKRTCDTYNGTVHVNAARALISISLPIARALSLSLSSIRASARTAQS